ncbi:MAG: 5-dehydro-4-deoxy-D-glucuronate isomerase [Candidatus Marinimicrobia bacterium]|nr:5-dehydro-4-deoxy-D-glucuronate isomerase [Candidatus Neomarinimicrobiota bacterium]
MHVRYLADPERFPRMTTKELRETFLVKKLFQPGKLEMLYCDTERAVVAGAVPSRKALELKGGKELASDYFAQRREVGIINIGATGSVTVDGQIFHLEKLDALYIGRGTEQIQLASKNPEISAEYYILSYPAHKKYPTKLIHKSEANKVELGSVEASNKRTIYQYIRPGVAESCQLVMGLTILTPGCVWNTFPPHTHARRTEIYLYFDLAEDARVFHMMGSPSETRHLVMKNKEAVISPSWSIHAGAGSSSYTFIWGMGGENQEFDDMDFINVDDIR